MKVLSLFLILVNLIFTQVDYSSQIQPIFDANCGNCHLGNSSGGLNLSNYENLMQGSDNGEIVIPGNHMSSILYDRITRDNADAGDMPPGNSELIQSEIDLIAQWIDEGALFEPNPLVGDINNDGIVNILDIIIIANIALGQTEYDETADINGDTIINILDIIELVNIIFS